jgi:hypothetical protein
MVFPSQNRSGRQRIAVIVFFNLLDIHHAGWQVEDTTDFFDVRNLRHLALLGGPKLAYVWRMRAANQAGNPEGW